VVETGGLEMRSRPVGKYFKIQHNLCLASSLHSFRSLFLFT